MRVLQIGWTPLHFGSSNGHLDVVRYLVEERGAEVNVNANAQGAVSEFD
jgi:ankyrin repeat protein